MNKRPSRRLLMLAILAMTTLGARVEASKCTSAELKATSKKVSCKLGAYAAAAAKSVPVDPAKLAACETKFSAAFAKAESAKDCVAPAGDQGAVIEGKVDAFVADVNAELGAVTTTTTVSTTTTSTVCSCTPTQCQATSMCDGAGGCTTTNKSDGTGCDDGVACTMNDVCTAGVCGGTAYTCPASTECATFACDGAGGCITTPVNEGGSCGPICCVGGRTCNNGTCTGVCCNTVTCCSE